MIAYLLLALPALVTADDPLCALGVSELISSGSGAGDQFGSSCSISGDTALVGAGPGVAYVFVRNAGVWIEEAVLTFRNSPSSVSLFGDTAFIGTPSNDDAAMNAGSVFVFTRSGTTWSAGTQLFASDAAAGDQFGVGVTVAGETAVIGATKNGVGGAAYIFERSGGIWAEGAKLAPNDLEPLDDFGISVSLSADTVLISALVPAELGVVYVFVRSGGLWNQQASFCSPASDRVFLRGPQVSLSGNTAVVGSFSKGALVFERIGSTWTEQAALEPEPGAPQTFGTAVAIDGDVAVVGGGGWGVIGGGDSAVFVRNGATWTRLSTFPADRGFSSVGSAVAVAGDTVLVGDPRLGDSGETLVYDLPELVAPSIDHRNAGTNPDSFRSTPAYIGQTLQFTVDLTMTGHDQALVFGFDSSFGFTLGGGQILLCLDLLGSGGELINTGFHSGPMANMALEVPANPNLIGFFVSTQAIHAFGVVPFALSNAQDIVIGGCL